MCKHRRHGLPLQIRACRLVRVGERRARDGGGGRRKSKRLGKMLVICVGGGDDP